MSEIARDLVERGHGPKGAKPATSAIRNSAMVDALPVATHQRDETCQPRCTLSSTATSILP